MAEDVKERPLRPIPRLPDMQAVQSGFGRMLGRMAGENEALDIDLAALTPYLPQDMVAGAVPHIPGMELNAVWHAAVQACAPSAFISAIPPKAAGSGISPRRPRPSPRPPKAGARWPPLYPGQSEHWDKETVYLYEQEGQASALRWDPESGRMQLYLGPSRTILPRIQSMNANFVTINPETARPVPWINRNLRMERMARYASLLMLLSGAVTTLCLIVYLAFLSLMLIGVKPALQSVRNETIKASEQLVTHSYQAFASNVPKYLVRVQELHQALYEKGGLLLRFELDKEGKVVWEALVPQAVAASDNPAFRGAKPTGEINSEDGRVRISGTE